MRRLARHLFTLRSLLSLMLCVATSALWARSYWVADECGVLIEGGSDRRAARSVYSAISASGALRIQRVASTSADPAWVADQSPVRARTSITRSFESAAVRKGWTTGSTSGFHFERNPREVMAYRRSPTGRGTFLGASWAIVFPHWLPIILTLGLCGAWLKWTRRWRARRMAGHCLACGYALRASPGRCPECGADHASGAAT